MQTKNDTSKPEDSPQQEAGEGCSGATCSPSSMPEADETYKGAAEYLSRKLRTTEKHLAAARKQRDIAVAELRRIQNTYGHKSADGCGCDDCNQIRPIEEALRAAQSLENAKSAATGCERNEHE